MFYSFSIHSDGHGRIWGEMIQRPPQEASGPPQEASKHNDESKEFVGNIKMSIYVEWTLTLYVFRMLREQEEWGLT